jgi:GNAT superfamily N-acetyltransferase
MLLRPVAQADLPRLLPLAQALAQFHGQPPRLTEDSLARDVLGPDPWVHVLVAEAEGALVGYVAVLRLARFQFGQRGIDLHHVYVTEDHRGHGVGGALVAAALDLGARLGASYATVTATPDNLAAQKFYAALGFAPAPRFGMRFAVMIPPASRPA